MYLQGAHLPYSTRCATQIHTKLANILAVSVSRCFWQRLYTKKRNVSALFSFSKHWLLYCITWALIIVNRQMHKCFLSRWRSADLQHRTRPGSTTWADKLNRGCFWWRYYSSHVGEWNFPKWEQCRKIKQTRQWNNYLKISSFLAHWQMDRLHLAKYMILTSCLSIWTQGAEREHRSEEERDSEKSEWNCRRWERCKTAFRP